MSDGTEALLALGYAGFLLALSAVLARGTRGAEAVPWPHGETRRMRLALSRMLAVLAIFVVGVACLHRAVAGG